MNRKYTDENRKREKEKLCKVRGKRRAHYNERNDIKDSFTKRKTFPKNEVEGRSVTATKHWRSQYMYMHSTYMMERAGGHIKDKLHAVQLNLKTFASYCIEGNRFSRSALCHGCHNPEHALVSVLLFFFNIVCV